MKSTLLAAAFMAGLAAPAGAATFLDFTSSGIGIGNLTGTTDFGVGYEISGFGGALTDATHKNDVGCGSFACDPVSGGYDVGFGVQGGGNNNEVDGISGGEYVQVAFDSVVKVLAFAGMLTYNDSQSDGTEYTVLEYSSDGGSSFTALNGITQNDDNDPGVNGDNLFNTVGLSLLSGLSVYADVVRFYAGGTSPFDDGNANITAAGLKVAAVPLPAAFPLLLAGVGALGWASRRRNRSAS